MIGLRRNKQKFYYSTFIENVPITDEYGNQTSEWEAIYSNPILCFGNVNMNFGENINYPIGIDHDVDKVIYIDNLNTPITEHSLIWFDIDLNLDDEGKTQVPHNYVVKKISKSLNHMLVAIDKVNVR